MTLLNLEGYIGMFTVTRSCNGCDIERKTILVMHGSSKKIAEYVGSIVRLFQIHRYHEIYQLLMNMITDFPPFGCPSVNDFAMLRAL